MRVHGARMLTSVKNTAATSHLMTAHQRQPGGRQKGGREHKIMTLFLTKGQRSMRAHTFDEIMNTECTHTHTRHLSGGVKCALTV